MNKKYFTFSIIETIIILWQILLPGYALTMDMVFGPHNAINFSNGVFFNSLPLRYILHFLYFLMSGWLVEKVILTILFFLLFYLPLYFLPRILKGPISGGEYVAATFFAINPFVYERFLAGQWTELFAYALLWPFTCFLIDFYRKTSWKNMFKLAGITLLIGIFSLHLLVMSAIISIPILIMILFKDPKKALAYAITLIILNSYWLLPYVLHYQQSVLQGFDQNDEAAYATAGGSLHVLSLYGFWAEKYQWANYFIWPQSMPRLFFFSEIALALLVLIGIARSLVKKPERCIAIFFIFIGVLGFIFSIGLAPTFFAPVNQWLFNHVFFWRGFRDTEKWSALLALSYAFFIGYAATCILELTKKRYVLYLLILIPLLYTSTMLIGFSGQLPSVWYPQSWAQANQILQKDSACKAVFLPWHQYYSLSFDDNLIVANTASSYFDCTIVSSQDPEIGQTESEAQQYNPTYNALDGAITSTSSNQADIQNTINTLKEQGIEYIIFSKGATSFDPYKYGFLSSPMLKKVINNEGLALYKLM